MAVPKRRTSKSRKRLRRGHHTAAGIAHPGMSALRLAQALASRVRSCGYYEGKKQVEVEDV